MSLKELPCFRHVQWDPSQTELRKFAKAMVVGFAVIGLLVAWRRHEIGTPTLTLWSVGAGLAVAAVIPGLGKLAYLAVYIVTGVIGFVVSRIVLAAVFFLLFAPLGLVLKLSGKDLLRSRRNLAGTEWIAHPGGRDRKSFYRQF